MKRLLFIVLCAIWPSLMWAQRDAVTFSQKGGIYEESFTLSLHCSIGNHIRYTTNGSTPDSSSTLYTNPLPLDESLYSTSDIYTIVDCIPSTYYLPSHIQHAIVIRAAVFNSDEVCISPVATNSYFIKALGCDLHGLPVASIATDSLSLFDYETGILVPGINYDYTDSTHTGNYFQTGKDWERLINLEFYEPNNTGVNQICGLRTHGGASRWYQQKGLRVYAREEYGKKRFKHRFFNMIPISSFKRLNFHPFRCSNWLQTGGQEYLSQKVAANLDFESLAVRQTVLFINGEYWGIYTLEESPDERYLEDHYDVDIDEVNIFKYWGVSEHGDGTDWWTFRTWIKEADLSQPEDSTRAFTRIDVASFIDYILFETYSANLDWPQNNTLHWQPKTGEQFRWIFYDGDGCFTRPHFDATFNALNQGGNSLIFKKFIMNPYFCSAFFKRYLELAKTEFDTSNLTRIMNDYYQLVDGEIVNQSERFHFPYSRERWLEDMEKAKEFFVTRPAYFKEELLTYISVDEPEIVSFTCAPNPSSGSFHIRFYAESNYATTVEIYDVLGRKVLSKEFYFTKGDNSIPIQVNLQSGLYFIKLDRIVTRIIIK